MMQDRSERDDLTPNVRQLRRLKLPSVAIRKFALAALVVLSGISVGGGVASAAGATQAHSGGGDQPAPSVWDTSGRCTGANAATATQAQADAQRLASDLRQLAADHPVLVPQEQLKSINGSLDSGREEFDLGEYEQACQAFVTAENKARGALKTYYPKATRANLDAASQVIDAEGTDDPARASALENRHDRLADRLTDAKSVSAYARLYQQSEDLLADARELEPTLLERVLAALPPGVTVLLCLSLAALLVQYLLRDNGPGGPGIIQ